MLLNHHGYGWNYCVMMAMIVFGAIQQSITLRTGRSLMLLSLAEDEFIQVSQSVQQTSHFTAAGACRVSLGLPLVPHVAEVLAKRFGPRFWLRQHEDRRRIFWCSARCLGEGSFIQSQSQRRHAVGQCGKLEQYMATGCETQATLRHTCDAVVGCLLALFLRVKCSLSAIVEIPREMKDRFLGRHI